MGPPSRVSRISPALYALSSDGKMTEVADVFLKASLPQPALALPRASSRSELRTSLDSHPRSLALLELELDTLAEDWLLALQDELTKPYFLSVLESTLGRSMGADASQLKEFIVAEQKGKKVFPLGELLFICNCDMAFYVMDSNDSPDTT